MLVPKSFATETLIVKKSRFIAWADRVDCRDDFKQLLARAVEQYPDARHHCWAYSAFNGRDEGCNDDGEPKGTAGRPMLNVLQHSDVTNVGVVVIRYFGGTKLGTGGLARAYGEATKMVLDVLVTEEFSRMTTLSLLIDFSGEQLLRHIVSGYNASIDAAYHSDGMVAHVCVSESDYVALTDELSGAFPNVEISRPGK